jgi:hypothetical protein
LGVAGLSVGREGDLRGYLVLAGTTARTLAGDHHSCLEQLSAPDAPGLPALQGAGEALGADRAVQAEGLGNLHVLRRLGEEQLWALSTARQLLPVDGAADLACGDRVAVEDAGTHSFHLQVTCLVGGDTKRPRIPGFGFRGLEAAD